MLGLKILSGRLKDFDRFFPSFCWKIFECCLAFPTLNLPQYLKIQLKVLKMLGVPSLGDA